MTRQSRPPERDIVEATERYFISRGLRRYIAEAPAGGRRIDLLCMDPKHHEYHAVEAKVDAPTHAFTQAYRYRFFANYCYVAILAGRTNETAMQLAKTSGIGLILVAWIAERNSYDAKLVVMPDRSSDFLPELGDFAWRTASCNHCVGGEN